MDVELRHLRAFVAVAASRSFTRAADRLLITQPALTRTIKQLESTLRSPLIDRSTHPISLTAAGERFLPYATQVLNHLDRGIGELRGQATVRLGFSWLLPDPWAQQTVSAFEHATEATVSLHRYDDPIAALSDGSIDVAVVRGVLTPTGTARLVHLFDEPRIAVVATTSELSARDHLSWNDVPRHTLVVNTISGTTGPWSWPAGNQPERIINTANFDEWLESVVADRGIGVVPDVAQRRNIHPGLSYIPLSGAPLSPVSLALRPTPPSPLIRQFLHSALDAVDTGAARR